MNENVPIKADTLEHSDPSNIILSFGERFSYAIYDFGYMVLYYWINAFMNTFFTDVVGVSLASVVVLTVVVRIFDAINDPIIGAIADNSRTKGGKFAPWLRWGGVALAVLVTLMFAVNPGWSTGVKTAWVWVTYLLVTVASTICYMPYTALNGVITSNTQERTKASSLRNICSTIGGQVVGLVAVTAIVFFSGASSTSSPDSARGYMISVMICAVVFIICAFITSKNCKEVVRPSVKQQTIPIKTQLKAFVKNPYAWILCVLFLVMGISQYGRSSVMVYYATYVAHDMKVVSNFAIVTFIAAIIGNYFGVYMHKVTKDKKRAIIIIYAIHAAVSIPLAYLNPLSLAYWVFTFFSNATVCGVAGIAYGMVGDVTDYGEYKYGVRTDGLVSALTSMLMKAGGALSPAIILLVLDKEGFIPNVAEQTAGVNATLTFGMSWLLVLSAVVTIIAFFFYRLSDKKMLEMRMEIAKQHEADEKELAEA